MRKYSGALDAHEEKELLAFAHLLADASGGIIRHYYRTPYAVESKADASPVTVADRKAEEVMRDLIAREYPQHGVLGEEYGEHLPDAQYRWVLDPIDGTKAFVSGTYLFGTLIALLKDGRPVLGVIHQPILRDYLVGTGEGAWLNGQQVRAAACGRVEEAILSTTDHWQVGREQNGAAFEALSRRVKRYQNWGDCHGYYLVATGGIHVMGDPVMNPWDLLALVPIIEGAGGEITDWHGGDPVVGSSIVATGGGIHREVIAALNP